MNDIETMLAEIDSEAAFTSVMTGRETLSERVMAAMRRVPRDRFVPQHLKAYAFDNGPLPIGHGQTISQPYIVALMTDLLNTEKQHTILEIGTGSGYQTAVLAELVDQVYTLEVIGALSEQAKECFEALHYSNITTGVGNGYEGWSEHAPYDGIMVTAAASHIPDALVQQLKPGGRLVIPVGLPYLHQELLLLEKRQNGQTHVTKILDVAFVPLVDYRKVETTERLRR
jgi:protein-L-isoaspartate(D-aspartate) O-methyltransferase